VKKKSFLVRILTYFCCLAPIVVLACSEEKVTPKKNEKPVLQIAVASNFSATLKMIISGFEYESGVQVVVVPGATGRHYAQIKNGAPYDILLAADLKTPQKLESENLIVKGSRFSYAFGRLVLWSPQSRFKGVIGEVLFEKGKVKNFAIANPKLAPYGRAAQEVLESWDMWDKQKEYMVQGENVAQVYQFVQSENAQIGFIALSQIEQLKMNQNQKLGVWWEIPHGFYSPIEQQGVLLKDTPGGRAFMKFMKSDYALDVIRMYGYGNSNP
jgi:molybdate transport system substrate-binding protein